MLSTKPLSSSNSAIHYGTLRTLTQEKSSVVRTPDQPKLLQDPFSTSEEFLIKETTSNFELLKKVAYIVFFGGFHAAYTACKYAWSSTETEAALHSAIEESGNIAKLIEALNIHNGTGDATRFFYELGYDGTRTLQEASNLLESGDEVINALRGESKKLAIIKVDDLPMIAIKTDGGDLPLMRLDTYWTEKKELFKDVILYDEASLNKKFSELELQSLENNGVELTTSEKNSLDLFRNQCTILQARLRGRAAKYKAHGGMVPVLKNSNGTIVAANINRKPKTVPVPDQNGKDTDKRVTINFPWVSLPPEDYKAKGNEEGAYKKLVSKAEHPHVILEVISGFGMPPCVTGDLIDKGSIEHIMEENYKRIVPQFPLDEKRFIAETLGGGETLHTMVEQKKYTFKPSHFAELAAELDQLHRSGRAHRDIKLENMYFDGDNVILTDLDSLGSVGSFAKDFYSPCLPRELRPVHQTVDNNPETDPISAYKKDQYTFFAAMVRAGFIEVKPGMYQDKFDKATIENFVKTMPCNDNLKQELSNFLNNPSGCFLKSPLSAFFKT